ncbi:MAG: TetR/AcrR family transcriptional regulator [Pseudomonadota bacterium]
MHLQTDPNQRRQPKQLRSRLMVETIVEAARQIFSEQDFKTASTNLIAERAGISIGSLYQYFPNKDSLILAVQKKHHDEVLALVKGAMDRSQDLPLRDAISLIVGANLDMHLQSPRLHAAFDEWIPTQSKHVDRESFQQDMAANVLNFLSERPDVDLGGQLKPAVFVIMNMVRSVMHAAVQDCETVPDRHQIIESLTVSILGCLTPGAESRS